MYILFLEIKCYYTLNLTSVHILIQNALVYVFDDLACYTGNTSVYKFISYIIFILSYISLTLSGFFILSL